MTKLPSPSTYPCTSILPLMGMGWPLKYGLVFGAGEKRKAPETVRPLGVAVGVVAAGCAGCVGVGAAVAVDVDAAGVCSAAGDCAALGEDVALRGVSLVAALLTDFSSIVMAGASAVGVSSPQSGTPSGSVSNSSNEGLTWWGVPPGAVLGSAATGLRRLVASALPSSTNCTSGGTSVPRAYSEPSSDCQPSIGR